MARARGGNAGLAVALVIFGCGFVIALLVAIIFYTKIETEVVAQQTAEQELLKYVKPSETGPANDFVSPNASVYANMNVKIKELQDDLRRVNDEVTRLDSQVASQNAAATQLVTDKDEVEARLNAEREQYNSIMADRQEKIDALIEEKDALTKQIDGLRAQVADAIKNADQAAQDRIAELNTQVADFETKLDEATKKGDRLAIQLQQEIDARPKLPAPNTTLPDGEVASVFGDGRNLFITLGRNHGLVLGMTFEVYDPEPIIRLNVVGEARGKATVEVYGLEADSATCRVVRFERGASIDPGDPIVNIGYDPNMDISMYPFGYFDIEGDRGTNDIERIKSLILATTASVAELSMNDQGVPVLTPDIDYIVLGAKPELPDPPSPDEFDPEKLERYRKALEANDAYFRIVDEAKLLRIPILNQNRFLELTGYYQR